MIVLVVDDEIAVKEALELLIDWEAYGVKELLYAENGNQALELMETKLPDIMFCDMHMPKMNGIKLLDEMNQRGYRTKVIAVSGYNDFSYVKATIQAGGLDYILKPLDGVEVEEALAKAIELCAKESFDTMRERKYKKLGEESLVQVLRQWVEGKHGFDEETVKALEGCELHSQELFVAIIVFQNPIEMREVLFEGDGALVRFTQNNIVEEIFGSSACQLIDVDEFFQVLLIDGKKVNTYEIMLKKFLKINEEYFNLQGLYEFDNQAVSKEKIFQQIEVLKYRMLSKRVHPISCEAVVKKNVSGSVKGMEHLLYAALQDNNLEGIHQLIEEFCCNLGEETELTFRELQFQTIEINLMIGRILHERITEGMSEIKPISVWIFDLKLWGEMVKHALYQLAEYSSENKLNMEHVYRYLQEHYAENITIDTLTECFYQSPQSISKNFKEKYSITIVTALRQIRMHHAKKFLKTTSIPILEVAKKTGYEDENYFGKVFKKETGVSPKSYRLKAKENGGEDVKE